MSSLNTFMHNLFYNSYSVINIYVLTFKCLNLSADLLKPCFNVMSISYYVITINAIKPNTT